jgi:predicted phage-related endonuclease
MTRANWLKLRKSGLGGTDMSSLLYPDDWGGPLTVYFDKLSPVADEGEFNWRMAFGNWSEEPMRNTVLPTFLVLSGLLANQFKVYTSPWFYRSTQLPWLTANIDGLIEFLYPYVVDGVVVIPAGLYVLELKTANYGKKDVWENGQTPDRYYTQAQHYVRGLKLKGAVVFALIGDTPTLRYLPAHEEFHRLIETTGTEAWRQIQERDPPAAFGGDSDLALVRKLYPVGGETAIEFPGLTGELVDFLAAKKQLKEDEARVKAMDAHFKSEIGDASGLVEGENGIKWTRGVSKSGRAINRLTVRLKGKEEEEE